MADQKQGRSRNGSGSHHSSNGSGSSSDQSRNSNKLSAREAVERVREEFPSLLGRRVESVLGVQRDDDGGWEVTVQVVELARIPNSTDVLGSYAVTLDDGGELVGYQRRRRYNRGQPDED